MRRIASAAFILGLLSIPASAPAEVVSSSDRGFALRSSAEVPVSPMDVWRTLIVPAKWWDKDHTQSGDAANLYLDSQATGCFCEKLPLPEGAPQGVRPGSVEHMHIVLSSPGEMLRMVGGLGPLQTEAVHAVLTISLEPRGEKTRIVWDYVVGGYMHENPSDAAPVVDGVLVGQLHRLVAALTPEPEPEAIEPQPVAGGLEQAVPLRARRRKPIEINPGDDGR